jgi:DNA-binding XRE family transcriptional regulator
MTYWTPEQFRQARLDLGMTRTELADALDCGLRTVERCEAEGCRKVMAYAMQHLEWHQDWVDPDDAPKLTQEWDDGAMRVRP